MSSLLSRPHVKRAFLWGTLGFLVGIVIWNGFITSLEVTGTTEFCTSCHSMKAYIYPNYQKSFHYKNSKGIQAGCSDCHIPKPLVAKLIRKTIGLKDIYHTVLGTIDTPEKFAARKLIMDERVWNRMKASNSRECRNCHNLENMDLEQQSPVARNQHRDAIKNGKTCVDCHHGVGHNLPVAEDENAEMDFSLE
ncbi:MAG: NapC/NirT family cytochrome c [Gammaproteobacteria bacterium]